MYRWCAGWAGARGLGAAAAEDIRPRAAGHDALSQSSPSAPSSPPRVVAFSAASSSPSSSSTPSSPHLHHFHPQFHHPIIHAAQHTISPLTGTLLIFAIHKAWQLPAALATLRAASALRAAGELSAAAALRVRVPALAAAVASVGLGTLLYRTATEPHDPVTGAPLSSPPPPPPPSSTTTTTTTTTTTAASPQYSSSPALAAILPSSVLPFLAPPTASPDLSARLAALYPPNEVPAVARALSGWPTSALVAALLRHMHDEHHVPWWASIAGFTVALRIVVAPFNLLLLRNSLRMKIILPDIKRLGDELARPAAPGDLRKVAAAKELRALLTARGASPWQGAFFFPFLMPPAILSVFGAVHNLAMSEPGMATEGALWFPDLVARDKTQFLPILSALTWLWQVEMGAGVHYAAWPAVRLTARVTALAMVPLSATLPSGVFVFWVTSNLFAVARGYAARTNAVRRALNIPLQKDILALPHLPVYRGV